MKDFHVILGIKAFFKNDDYELLSKFSPLTIPIAKGIVRINASAKYELIHKDVIYMAVRSSAHNFIRRVLQSTLSYVVRRLVT